MKTLSEINPNPQDSEKLDNLTIEAIEELECIEGKKYSSFKSMIDDLDDDA
ncbi:hypothetical protein [Legionella maioricensis]|uniref:Uncharacterized protein n=1 Tax=Legionella maioricensis TaxID=2896528 RepID=A0A9X2D367_9GAMM|nr:hypothetical protein [Legionella maioricensis]MCL9685870.1 hypothetical protein [Legionella maioricensis]MCL9686284.1 hypothetical protein [Legionella maioricensis]